MPRVERVLIEYACSVTYKSAGDIPSVKPEQWPRLDGNWRCDRLEISIAENCDWQLVWVFYKESGEEASPQQVTSLLADA